MYPERYKCRNRSKKIFPLVIIVSFNDKSQLTYELLACSNASQCDINKSILLQTFTEKSHPIDK